MQNFFFDNIELLDPKDSVVCAVKLTRVAKGMAAEEEELIEEAEETEETTEESEKTKEEIKFIKK